MWPGSRMSRVLGARTGAFGVFQIQDILTSSTVHALTFPRYGLRLRIHSVHPAPSHLSLRFGSRPKITAGDGHA